MEREMRNAQAVSIINAIALDHGTGLLETLEYMQSVYNEGHAEWSEQFDLEERRAYWIVMDGMQEMFFGPREELEAA
jgi:hypothetical protein